MWPFKTPHCPAPSVPWVPALAYPARPTKFTSGINMLQNRQIARPAWVSVAFAGWFVVATVAYAQTASHLVSPSYAPPVVRPVEGGISFDGATGLDAPRGAEKLSVTPSGLIAEGGRPELSAETAKVEASLKGIRVTGADLFAAARQLEEAYARAGYLLVRVSLPPQTVKNGKPLHLVVTDGQVEAIDVSALPENVRSRIQDVLAPLVGKTGLTKAELERRLLLAGDTPGVMLKSTLKAGSKSAVRSSSSMAVMMPSPQRSPWTTAWRTVSAAIRWGSAPTSIACWALAKWAICA